MRLATYLLSVSSALALALVFASPQQHSEPEPVSFSWHLEKENLRPEFLHIRWEDGRRIVFDCQQVSMVSYFPEGNWGLEHGYLNLTVGAKTQRIDLPNRQIAEQLMEAIFIDAVTD